MFMKKSLLAYALVPAIGLGAIGVGFASAHGPMFGAGATPDEIATRQTEMFTTHATLLGVSVDEVKQAWAEGKTMREFAAAKGITDEQLKEKMQTARKAQMETHMSALVAKGVITQAQADQHKAAMEKRMTEGGGKKGEKGRGGFGGHRGGMMGL